MFRPVLAGLVFLLGIAGCGNGSPPTTGGSTLGSGTAPHPDTRNPAPPAQTETVTVGPEHHPAGWAFTSSNGYYKDGAPGVAVFFGTFQPPGMSTEILYLVLAKHARKSSNTGVGNHLHSDSDGHVEIVDGLAVDGAAAKLGAWLEADRSTGKLKREEFALNGEKIDISRGRLFLVDLTVDPVKWQQVDGALPEGLPGTMDRETVRRVGQDEVTALRRTNGAVNDFFK